MLIYNYILKIMLMCILALYCFVTVYIIMSYIWLGTNECYVPYDAVYWNMRLDLFILPYLLIILLIMCMCFLFTCSMSNIPHVYGLAECFKQTN